MMAGVWVVAAGMALAGTGYPVTICATDMNDGTIVQAARIKVVAADGTVLCEGRGGEAKCTLGAGRYRVVASAPGRWAHHAISIPEAGTDMRVGMRADEPVDYQAREGVAALPERLVTVEGSDGAANGPLWLRVEAVHDSLWRREVRLGGGSNLIQDMAPGLYLFMLSGPGSPTRTGQFRVDANCRDLRLRAGRDALNVSCSR